MAKMIHWFMIIFKLNMNLIYKFLRKNIVIIGNGHNNPSSSHGCDSLHFTFKSYTLIKCTQFALFSPAMGKK